MDKLRPPSEITRSRPLVVNKQARQVGFGGRVREQVAGVLPSRPKIFLN